jgi:hypothetical protein
MRSWHRAKGIPDVDADRETERFKRDALAKDRRYADWSAAWRNWLDKAGQWGHVRVLAAVPDDGSAPAQRLTPQQVEDALGPDVWQLPPSPFDPEEQWDEHQAWNRRAVEEHRADRERRARAELERRVPT